MNALNVHPKVVGGTLAGTLAAIVVYALTLAGIHVPDVAAAALTTGFAGLGGWLVSTDQAFGDPVPEATFSRIEHSGAAAEIFAKAIALVLKDPATKP